MALTRKMFYRGRNIEDLTKEELIAAIRVLGELIEQAQEHADSIHAKLKKRGVL